MIFNFGENPTLDVFRMLMHYAVQQKKSEEPQSYYSNKVLIPGENGIVTDVTDASSLVSVVDGPRRLHITNLPFKIRDNELRALFETYGTVVDAEIIFNERGSKGFGFVTMETVEAAVMAKDALNGKEMEGRKIEVNNATPRSTPTKSPLRLKNKLAPAPENHHKNPYNEMIQSAPVMPSQTYNGCNAWAQQAFALNSAPVPSPQLTLQAPQMAPPPPFNFTQPAPPINMTGFHCYPTPEQYAAQYYSYIASQGALRNSVPKTAGSIANYRFQPY